MSKSSRAREISRYFFHCGAIKQTPCAICRAEESSMHHPDYERPAFVIWLCRKCHWAVHADGLEFVERDLLTLPDLPIEQASARRAFLADVVGREWKQRVSVAIRQRRDGKVGHKVMMRFLSLGGRETIRHARSVSA